MALGSLAQLAQRERSDLRLHTFRLFDSTPDPP